MCVYHVFVGVCKPCHALSPLHPNPPLRENNSFSRNVLYAASADGTVSALDVRSGDLLWVLPGKD